MKTGTFLGVAAIMGAMIAADAQAAQGERIRGSGATRVGAIRGMDGFRASEIRGFRGARTFSQPRLVSSRRVIVTRPVAYRSRGEFIRPSRRVVRSEFVRPVAYRRGVAMRERRLSSARFANRDRFVVRRGEFIRPSRRVIRSEFVRPVAFRRGVAMRERRLSSVRFADRDRFVVRRGEFRRGDLRERRRLVRRAAFLGSAYAPAYYSSYYPNDYYSSYNYPADYFTPTTYYTPTYSTPSTYYTTVTTAPRYTYALTGTSTLLSVQTQLAELGYYEGALDGIMGPRTRSAILRYERDRGLPGFGSISRTLLISLGLA